MSDNHALVFGASGLAGWAVVDELLSNYPAPATFRKITALVNRPLKLEDSWWPTPSPDTPDFELVAGVNLLNEEFAAFLKDKVPDIDTVTHVFYFGPSYKQEDDWGVETRVNSAMFERVVNAVDTLAPALKFVVFPSGTRGYGIHVPGGLFPAPLVETMDPLLPEPHRSNIFYHAYQRTLRAASAGKAWTWAEIRPDAIIGFTPTGSTYALAAHWASYLSTYALVHGPAAAVPFPGTPAAWAHAVSNDAAAATVARASVWASLHPEVAAQQLFNVADERKGMAMSERWPRLAEWFGLEGVAPGEGEGNDGGEEEGEEGGVLMPSAFVEKHRGVLEGAGVKKGASVWQAEALDAVGSCYAFDRTLSVEKIREAGFVEERDAIASWYRAFERYREAGMIV
ncbi:hypothetical protein SLS55_002774 [Diplodia seriata]|uniref:PRISE-like Rossmann-fold domain-containing protein n=1 Tax=Diplodia seriata TaxID=420778 RepID=A0ABR3CL34_9PEZI